MFIEGHIHFGIMTLYEPKQVAPQSNPNTILFEYAVLPQHKLKEN